MSPLAADFIRGAALGFSVAAPVGPIGLLCIRRTLEHGVAAGIAGGLGTAAADAAYAGVAAFGLTAVAAALAAVTLPLQVVGIAMLAGLGLRTFTQPPAAVAATPRRAHAGVFAQTFVLTLANPATILSFAAIFAGMGLMNAADAARAGALVGGTFAGSLAWWIVLSGVIGLARSRISPTHLLWINRAAGIALIVFAAVLAANAARLAD
ncbi:MAG: LysE family translocator [Rhodospirillaceae bacterium]